jgi:hypothetical protein
MVDAANPDTWTIAALNNDTAGGFADGALAGAKFRNPSGLFYEAGRLYVADTGNHVIRALDLTAGTSSTVAGVPQTRGFFGDGGPATSALLYGPMALTRCANGDWFVADTANNRVRRIASDGRISTVLGDGVFASSGEGTPAVDFPVAAPLGVTCDSRGNVFVTSTSTVRMLPANDVSAVDGLGPVQTIYGAPPRERFPESVTRCLTGLAVKDDSTLELVDSCTGMQVELSLVHQAP